MTSENPVRPPCQGLGDLAEGIGVLNSSCEDKLSSLDPSPHICQNSGAKVRDSLSQARTVGIEPDRPGIGASCQARIGDGDGLFPAIRGLSGFATTRSCQDQPVRMEVRS